MVVYTRQWLYISVHLSSAGSQALRVCCAYLFYDTPIYVVRSSMVYTYCTIGNNDAHHPTPPKNSHILFVQFFEFLLQTDKTAVCVVPTYDRPIYIYMYEYGTWMVEKAMPTASTGTTVPSSSLHRRGVMTIAPRVVMVVIITDRAT